MPQAARGFLSADGLLASGENREDIAMASRASLAILLLAGVAACAAEAPAGNGERFAAEIRRTAYGVPHVRADDYGGLGYGIGYAAAEDNICELAERMLTVNGERAKYLGPGEGDANIASDVYHRGLIAGGQLAKLLDGPAGSPDTPSAEARALARGYVAGVSRYIADTGVENLPDARCRGLPYVRPMTETDFWRHVHAGQVVIQLAGIAGATPPGAPGDGARAPDDLPQEATALGSNAYALGREATKTGRGVLLGNPHYPWDGQNRFYRIHLMIPGELNVVGAGLVTNATVGIGHTDAIAWTHTVSTARRFGLFELTLDPADPTRYIGEGVSTPMWRTDVTVEVKAGAQVTPVTRTLYSTRHGALVETETLPWTNERAFAIRVMPQGVRAIDQYIAIWRAKSVRELKEALARYQATGFNTTAVDAGGEVFFGDMGMVPNVTPELVEACAISDLAREQWATLRIPVLDGSRAACDWPTGEGATAEGVFGPEAAPHFFRTDFASQSNDSHWLTNPAQPLEGYSPVYGDEAATRSLRTRLSLKLVEDRLTGADGYDGQKFDLPTLQQVMFNNRHLGAELVRDDLVGACRASGDAGLAPACDALAGWDLRVDLDSRGAHLFHLFAEAGGIKFPTPFDPADPVNTPHTLDVADPAVLEALRAAAKQLTELEIPLDARLGDVQRETRGEERIPIHGGAGPEGVFNVISVEDLEPKLGWTSIRHGSSWVMAVEFTEAGPVSRGVLTYSQSTNPASPHHSDQTRLYSNKGWDDLLFSDEAVEAATVSRKILR
jgi:acyl-homoserine-lactone acylase